MASVLAFSKHIKRCTGKQVAYVIIAPSCRPARLGEAQMLQDLLMQHVGPATSLRDAQDDLR